MKKTLFLLISTITLVGTAISQNQQQEQNVGIKNEHLLMKDGKILRIMDGQEMLMKSPMTLKNGVVIYPNGSYQLKNGKQRHLRNRQCMDMNGKKYKSQRMFQKKIGGHNMQMSGHGGNMMGTGSHSHH